MHRSGLRETERVPVPGLLLFVLTGALVAHPAVLLFMDEGLLAPFKSFAADAFYYLTVADHVASGRGFSFDGTHPTNGFHPLWQAYLGVAFEQIPPDGVRQMAFAYWSCALLAAMGIGFVTVATARITRSPAVALSAMVPGAYSLLTPSLSAPCAAPWGLMNGMESSLSVFLFGLLLCALTHQPRSMRDVGPRGLAGISFGLTLLTLCRLDDVFLFVPFLLLAGLAGEGRADIRRRILAVCLPPGILIGSYLVLNLSYSGAALPLSGVAKTSGLLQGLVRNAAAVVTTAIPYVDPLGRREAAWGSEAWRVLQMLLPAAVSSIWLLGVARNWRNGRKDAVWGADGLVTLLALYVVCKAGFNFCFVGLWHQGHWYYPLSILCFNLMLAVGVSRWADRRGIEAAADEILAPITSLRSRSCGRWVALMLAVIFASHHGNAFEDAVRAGKQGWRNASFWSDRQHLREALRRVCEGCGIVSFDDGIIAYSALAPTMNGLGLAVDVEAAKALQEGRLLDLAFSRGHRLLASINYPMISHPDLVGEPLRGELMRYAHLAREDLARWDFEVVHVHESTGTPFIRFAPRSKQAGKEGLE